MSSVTVSATQDRRPVLRRDGQTQLINTDLYVTHIDQYEIKGAITVTKLSNALKY